MSLKEKIEQAFKNNDYIPCCAKSFEVLQETEEVCSIYVRLPGTPGKDENEWHEIISNEVDAKTKENILEVNISHGTLKEYANYSHGLHPVHLRAMYEAMGKTYI